MTKLQDLTVAMNGATKVAKLFHLIFSRLRKNDLSYLLRFVTASHCNQAKDMCICHSLSVLICIQLCGLFHHQSCL